MADDMMLSRDHRSLHRGRRRAQRTQTYRPCLIWMKDAEDLQYPGVILNMNPYGMCVRLAESIPPGTVVMIQLMRDESFTAPLSAPVEGTVVRNAEDKPGHMDHGVEILQRAIERVAARAASAGGPRWRLDKRPPTRMHTIDLRVGGRGLRRTER